MQDMPADMATKNENADTKESNTAVSTNNNTNLLTQFCRCAFILKRRY